MSGPVAALLDGGGGARLHLQHGPIDLINVAEGLPSRGRNRGAHLQRALGSARECVACLDVAGALGYASETLVADARARVDRCCAALWCLVHRPRW